MVAYKIANSLLELRDQLDKAFPLRSKKSDGFVGDPSHQTRESDHNPWWLYGKDYYVTAGDFTHDPDNGVDADKLAAALVTAQDRRVKYVIRAGVIWDSRWVMHAGKNQKPWTPLPYTGPNPHKTHVHVSVLPVPESLTTTPWLLPGLEDDLPSVNEVWAQPIDDPYTLENGDTLPAFAALAWAAANSGHARDAAADAVGGITRVEQKLDALIAKLG